MYVKLPKNTDSNNFLTNRGKLSSYQKGIDKGQRKNPKIRHTVWNRIALMRQVCH